MRMFVEREFTFEAAHRLTNHAGRCRFLHGHSYKVSVTVERKGTMVGMHHMVVDFGDVKATIGVFIDQHFDHNTILSDDDPIAKMQANQQEMVCGRLPYVMPNNWQPTAEMIAMVIADTAQKELDARYEDLFTIVQVKVRETEKCCAELLL